MGMCRISVCMASYNGGQYIKQQLESILSQLGDIDEVIVSDDGSSDNTIGIVQEFNDKRIKLFFNSFHNLNLNFEFALKQASGEFVFLSDQDDVWMPNKVEEMLKALEKHDLVCSDSYIVNSNLEIIKDSFYDNNLDARAGFWRNFIRCNYIGCCMAFRKNILEKAIPFPEGLICHDVWIGLVAEAFGNPIFIDQRLIKYRRHSTNASQTTVGSTLSFKEKFSYRKLILWNIIKLKFLRKPPVFSFLVAGPEV